MSAMSSAGAEGAWSYRTGPWFAAFGSGVSVLLPESQRDQVIGVWSLVDDGAGFDEVLDALLASGLRRLPAFVLVSTDGGPTRVLLRGTGVSATLTTADEDVVLDGSASATWVERSVEGVKSLSVVLTEADGADDYAGTDLPILTGLVRAARIDRPAHAVPAGAEPAAAVAADEPAAFDIGDAGDTEASVDVGADAGVVVGAFGVPTGDPVPEAAPAEDEPAAMDVVAEDALVEDALVEDALVEDALVEDAVAEDLLAAEALAGDDSPPATAEDATADQPPMTEEFPVVGSEAAEAAAAEDAMDEASPIEADPRSDVVVPLGGDPLTDPLPPEGDVPAGWVTPWDNPPPPPPAPESADETPETPETPELAEDPAAAEAAPLADDAAPMMDEAEDEAAPMSDAPPPSADPAEPVTEFAPPLYAPPPPPSGDAPPVDLPPPPLPIGSWEPLGGFPPPPAAPAAPGDLGAMPGPEGEPPPAPAGPAPAEPVAKLMISDGQQVVVDRVILIGRAPEARRFTSTEQPHLVAVPSRLHEISSTHVEVRPGTGADHGTAVVTDMGSTNGTVLVQPGLGPEDLKPGIAVQLVSGAIINLGDGVTIQVTRP